jgi:hypothetical protein
LPLPDPAIVVVASVLPSGAVGATLTVVGIAAPLSRLHQLALIFAIFGVCEHDK